MSTPEMQKDVKFRERLVHRRNRLGWTQDQLAEKAVISKRSISDYERGMSKPSLDQLFQIAEALSVTVAWLIGESETPVLNEKPSGQTKAELRNALRSLKTQADALAHQIEFYEQKLCGGGDSPKESPPGRPNLEQLSEGQRILAKASASGKSDPSE